MSRQSRAFLLGSHVPDIGALKTALRRFKVNPRQDFLIGIDGGMDFWIRAGYSPHFGIGDWDSLERKALLKKFKHLTLSRDKDRSDLYFGIQAALSQGSGELLALGVTGGRADHHVASLLELAEAARSSRVQAWDRDARYFFVTPSEGWFPIPVSQGAIVSIFAWGGAVRGVSLRGFKYELKSASFKPSSLGLSNVAGARASVRVERGTLLVIVPVL